VNVAEGRSCEAIIVRYVDRSGAFEAERLEHAGMIVDGQWVIPADVGELLKTSTGSIHSFALGSFG
jgi:hypothetical protein